MKFFKNSDGATAIEYGLIAALIAVAVIAVMGQFPPSETAEEPISTPPTEEYDALYGDP